MYELHINSVSVEGGCVIPPHEPWAVCACMCAYVSVRARGALSGDLLDFGLSPTVSEFWNSALNAPLRNDAVRYGYGTARHSP